MHIYLIRRYHTTFITTSNKYQTSATDYISTKMAEMAEIAELVIMANIYNRGQPVCAKHVQNL